MPPPVAPALLHGIGMVAESDSHTADFDLAGGRVARVFAAGAGWPAERRQRLSEVIVRHMGDAVDVREDPEGHLLERATGVDVSGRHLDDVTAGLRAEVPARNPRAGLWDEFPACFQDQAAREPQSSPAASVRGGLAERVRANPLDRPDGRPVGRGPADTAGIAAPSTGRPRPAAHIRPASVSVAPGSGRSRSVRPSVRHVVLSRSASRMRP
ncbi:hypothetical protein ABZ871_17020 [Streptomyces populi]